MFLPVRSPFSCATPAPPLPRPSPPSQWAAVLAASALFGLVHFTAEGFLPLLLLGCLFGAAYVHSGRNMLPPVLLHSAWNVMLLWQLALSGVV